MNINTQSAMLCLKETQEAIEAISESKLIDLAELIHQTAVAGRFVWTAGNGGSASTAGHLACDINKGVSMGANHSYRAISINDQTATQSAWANDFGFENALKNQLGNLASQGDLLICISGSGNSPNIVNAAEYAQANGIRVASLVGKAGGEISKFSDFELRINSTDMQVLENVHLVVVHWLYKALAT